MMKRFLTSFFCVIITAGIAASSFGPLSVPVFAETAAESQMLVSEKADGDAAAIETTEGAAPSQADPAAGSEQQAAPDQSRATADNPIGEHCAHYNVDGFEDAPTIAADSAFLMDARTGAILYSYEGYTRRYPASITKVMTALLAIEYLKMDDKITFTKEAVEGIEAGSSTAGINAGAVLTVEDTLYALMLVSANEAGAAIAQTISGSDKAFGKLMVKLHILRIDYRIVQSNVHAIFIKADDTAAKTDFFHIQGFARFDRLVADIQYRLVLFRIRNVHASGIRLDLIAVLIRDHASQISVMAVLSCAGNDQRIRIRSSSGQYEILCTVIIDPLIRLYQIRVRNFHMEFRAIRIIHIHIFRLRSDGQSPILRLRIDG